MRSLLFAGLAALLLASVPVAARAQQAPAPGYPPQPGYPPAPGQPPAPGYPSQPGYPPPPGYPPQPSGYPPAAPPAGARAPTYDPAAAYAGAIAPAPGSRHHDGVFVRLALGPGYLAMAGKTGGKGAGNSSAQGRIRGPSAALNAAVGFAVSDSLILFGKFLVGVAPSPSLQRVRTDLDDPMLDVLGLGAGASYYLDPSNVHFTAAVLATQMELRGSGADAVTEATGAGLGLHLSAGKEWWLGDNLAVGGAAQVLTAWVGGQDRARWFALGLGLAFTATYN